MSATTSSALTSNHADAAPSDADTWDQWDLYEEDGPMDLEDQLDAALERSEVLK
jgi:hypothetical protein